MITSSVPLSKPEQPKLPVGTKKVIIFDTNGYRELTNGLSLDDIKAKSLHLRECERKAGIFALANPIVIWELIAHLADISDPAYSHCLNALVALAEHTGDPNNSNGGLCLFADPESTVCLELFNKVPPNAEEFVQNLSKIATHVKSNAPAITDSTVLNNFKVFSTEMNSREKEWRQDMEKVLNNCSPNAAKVWFSDQINQRNKSDKHILEKLRNFFASQDFMETWANVTVERHASMVNRTLSAEELKEKINIVREVFSVPFHLTSKLLQKIATPNQININSPRRKHWNFIWDFYIAFSIGNYHAVEDADMYMVTSDGDILEAAAGANCAHRVVSLDDYLNRVAE